jgi:molybdenum-dependent DNA-binding transcriptional regulator ModE
MVFRLKKRQGRIMFMNEGLVDLYLYLPKGPLVEACKDSGIAYTHALKMIKYWASLDLINTNKSGQQYNFFYTSLGAKLASELIKSKAFMKKNAIQWGSDEEY